MDSFALHNITHLSPSSLNLWREAPGIWAMRYLAKIRDDGNAAMWRGTAVESGLTAFLRGASRGDALNGAMRSFALNAQGEITDEIMAESDLIAPMLAQCMAWTPPSMLTAAQLKIELWFDGVPIPVIGYLDMAFESGIDIDLKTTKACPSAPRPDHVRQVSIYRAARHRDGGLLYVTGKRHAYFNVDDDMMERALADLQCDAISLYQFLGRVRDADDALACLPMPRDHFMFPKAPRLKVPMADVLLAG